MSDDLKPCPFCGDTGIRQTFFDGAAFAVCLGCQAEGPVALLEDDARTNWNTRPGEEALRVEVERLRGWVVNECGESACENDAVPGPCTEAPDGLCSECCHLHRCGGET